MSRVIEITNTLNVKWARSYFTDKEAKNIDRFEYQMGLSTLITQIDLHEHLDRCMSREKGGYDAGRKIRRCL